jgi:Tol biopolymer transport system component
VLTSPPTASFGDIFPRWSPRERTIAFSRRSRTTGHDVYLIDGEGSSLRSLTRGELGIRGLDWTPDGKQLVYSSHRNGTFGLWAVAVDDASVSWIPARAERIYHPTIADQAGNLVYEALSYEKDVWKIDLAENARRATASHPILTSTRWDCEAYYSPGGDRLVFTSSRSGALELWASDPDGTDLTQLTNFDGAFVGNPRWGPSGNRVAFKATPKGRSEVFVVDLEERSPRRLFPSEEGPSSANYWVTDWSRDGRWIYAASDRSGEWQLWKVRPDGSEMEKVTDNGAFAAQESVTGDTLFYTKPRTPGLWMRSSEDQRGRRILHDLARGDWGNWDVTGQGIYFIRRTDGPHIVFYSFESGQTDVVTSIPNLATPSLEVSPDGNHILYARIEETRSDLMAIQSLRQSDGPHLSSR